MERRFENTKERRTENVAKDSFILYTEQRAVIEKLSDEQAGKLIKAIYEYVETEQMPELDAMLDIVIIPFRQSLDRNKEKWEDVKEKRREAGKLGAEIKKQKKAKEANANFAKSEKAKQAVNVNDSVNVNVNENVNVVVDEQSDSCVDEVVDFYNNNIGSISSYAFQVLKDYEQDMGAELVVYAMQKAVEANARNIRYIKAILNSWSKKGIKSLYEAKEEGKENKTTETEAERKARMMKEMEDYQRNDNGRVY